MTDNNTVYVANDIKIRKGPDNVYEVSSISQSNTNGGPYIRHSYENTVLYYCSTNDVYSIRRDTYSAPFYDGQKVTIIGPNAIHIKPRPSNVTQVEGSISQHSKATTGQSIELMYYNGEWYTKEYTE